LRKDNILDMGASMQTTVNGVKINYTDEGKGLPVIFVHGFPLSRGTWQKQIEALRTTHRVIAPDLRGLGENDAVTGVATMTQFADDVHALLQQLKTGPVVLVGHSMGGYIALAFARKYPDMLRGLVLVATKAGADTPEAAAGRRATADKVKAGGSNVIVDAMAPKMLAAGNQDKKMADQVRAFMSPSKPESVIAALLGMAERSDSTSMLVEINAPTLVITGADDTVIPPAESEKLAAAIPGAQLKKIPSAGHLVAFEQPAEFNKALQDWLKGLKSS
jgi:pimeloyl-ACP methyl ester carboxylesterase